MGGHILDSVSLNYLHEEVYDRELPLGDNVYELLNPDYDKARKTFAGLVKDALREYHKHYPLVLEREIMTNLEYTFFDNFEAYLLGNISESSIQLIPEAISLVRVGRFNVITANNYEYRKPVLKHLGATAWVKYYAMRPMRYTLAPEGFSEDSRVYFISEDDDTFIDAVSYTVLNYIVSIRNSVRLPVGIDFFDFSARVAELKASIMDDFSVSHSIYENWR